MKKFLVVNIVIILLLLCVAEFLLFLHTAKMLEEHIATYNENPEKLHYNINLTLESENLDSFIKDTVREPVGLQYKKKPLVLFGCSYVFGSGLKKDTELVSYKLSEYTKRPVYNRGLAGKGIQHMYWQLNSQSLYDDIKTEPEYLFFFYSYELHAARLIRYTFQEFDDYLYLRYRYDKQDKKGDLIEEKPLLPKYLNGLYLVKYLEREMRINNFDSPKKIQYLEDYAFFLLHKSKEKASQHFPNAKFVIFSFDTIQNESLKHESLLKRLENDGFIVIRQSELTDISLEDVQYNVSENDPHPSEKYWDVVVPKLAKKLNL